MKVGQLDAALNALRDIYLRSGDKVSAAGLERFATLLKVRPEQSVSDFAKVIVRKSILKTKPSTTRARHRHGAQT